MHVGKRLKPSRKEEPHNVFLHSPKQPIPQTTAAETRTELADDHRAQDLGVKERPPPHLLRPSSPLSPGLLPYVSVGTGSPVL